MAGSVNPGEWIIEDYASGLITRFTQSSAVMGASSRTEPMRTNSKWIAKDTDAEVEVTQKGQTYNLDTDDVEKIRIDAAKITHASSYDEEDRSDAAAWQDITNAKKRRATSNMAVFYDNLALGVTGAQVVGSKTAPYESVYHAVATEAPGNIVTVSLGAADLSKAMWTGINSTLEIAEDSEWAGEDLVWVISTAFKSKLRGMDATGKNGVNFYVPPTGGDPNNRSDKGPHLLRGQIGAYPAYFTKGARLSAAGTYRPSIGAGAKGSLGNAFGVLVPASYLIVGNRSPLESQFLDSQNGNGGVGALSDTDYLKMRMRKGFKLAEAEAAAIIELIA